MKKCSRYLARGFTLIELIVVVAIMAIMLALAGTMMKNAGKGQGLQDAVQLLHDMTKEARLEAISKATWARLIVVSDPLDTSPNSKNLRYVAIMVKEPVRQTDSKTLGEGEWKIVSGARQLPPGFYVSPKYSTLVDSPITAEDVGMGQSSTFAQLVDKMRIGPKEEGVKNVYFIEFDSQGRMSEPSNPTRLVVMSAIVDPSASGDDAGIRPNPVDEHGLPTMVGGIVIWPKGQISSLHTREQIFKQL